ncbi:hypothetical protein CTTA_5019 [Comamonas testosteroni]|uniref:Uncharacterized protein n=1 Tax=Comamonas testosteroni TaxID=285 RepID=A0A5A7MML4_COMTE|nr:hypothetical protein [Comamonas testosteroni]GEQ78014.1 hypothetical protein CTTA_5019 [Comamonas testosteroni]
MIEQQQQLQGIIGVIGSELLTQRLFPIIDIEGRQQKRRVGMELDVAAGVLERLGHGQRNTEETRRQSAIERRFERRIRSSYLLKLNASAGSSSREWLMALLVGHMYCLQVSEPLPPPQGHKGWGRRYKSGSFLRAEGKARRRTQRLECLAG